MFSSLLFWIWISFMFCFNFLMSFCNNSWPSCTFEHLCPPPVFSGVRVSRSLVLFVDRCLSFFSPLWCLYFFDLQILITSLVSSNSFDHLQDDIEKVQENPVISRHDNYSYCILHKILHTCFL
jgi:hypothetical protein